MRYSKEQSRNPTFCEPRGIHMSDETPKGKLYSFEEIKKDKELIENLRKFSVKGFAVLCDGLQEEDLRRYIGFDYEMIFGAGTPVLLKADAPPELRKRIQAAALSYYMQLKSVDYARKKYFDE